MIVGIILGLLAAAEPGASVPLAIAGDPHVQSVLYRPDQALLLRAAIGYAVVVELSADEHVENIVLGNSSTWQVSANKRGDHLIIKPLAGATETDLVVTTETRRYVLLLAPAESPDSAPFVMRFDYAVAPTKVINNALPASRYDLHGDKKLLPASIGDDGRNTFLTWENDSSLPAIFMVNTDGNEEIVNGRVVDGAYVIEGVGSRLIFRRGNSHAMAIRKLARERRP